MPQLPPSFDLDAARAAITELIRALGLDPSTEPELAQTPDRVARLYGEIFSGLDPRGEPELVTFPKPASAGEELVLVRDLPFHSLCIHHFVPFFGRAHVAYLPGERLIGISGAPRVIERYARRPQLQERLGAQVADHLERVLAPRGLAVILEARHLCMEMRGIRTTGWVETRTLRGALADPAWAGALPAPRGPGLDPHRD
jgi:GTP cyclohydrolase I